MASIKPPSATCFVCAKELQMGFDRWDGTFVPRYAITVCAACYQNHWDGWAPDLEERLIQHLRSKGLPIPDRNDRGWLPRD
jgi:hypothetical protein